MKPSRIFILLSVLFVACTTERQQQSAPWQGEEPDSVCFDLTQIQAAGELIAVTLSGPDTYYDYMGRHLGVHFMLSEQFASAIGVRLRVEVCRDTAEVLSRINDGDADIAMLRLSTDTLTPGWLVGEGKPQLSEAIASWYRPEMLLQARQTERSLLSSRRVVRRVSAPMLRRGVVSHYDALFKQYARAIGWDWRLIAAQCYQESTFDPEARSWAGAVGLMQIMPTTADHLGLSRDMLTDPERNVEAATRLLAELESQFSSIADRKERQCFVLAAYNGGAGHISDAQRLAQRDGRNSSRWADVRQYVLLLSEPRYYQDTLVHYGYMRGAETADYVDRIRQRYAEYSRRVR